MGNPDGHDDIRRRPGVIEIAALGPDDRGRWAELWQDYLTFYKTTLPASRYERTWAELMAGVRIFGLGARQDGRLVGITHYLFHPSAWMEDLCYLQDLFVDPAMRGSGCGRALIEAVASVARERKCGRLYWSTQQDNATARLLYDRIAKFNGFIRYDYALT